MNLLFIGFRRIQFRDFLQIQEVQCWTNSKQQSSLSENVNRWANWKVTGLYGTLHCITGPYIQIPEEVHNSISYFYDQN